MQNDPIIGSIALNNNKKTNSNNKLSPWSYGVSIYNVTSELKESIHFCFLVIFFFQNSQEVTNTSTIFLLPKSSCVARNVSSENIGF